jgi:hypothetical protein
MALAEYPNLWHANPYGGRGMDWRCCWDQVQDSTPPCLAIYWRRGVGCNMAAGVLATAFKMVIECLPWQ